MKYTAYDIVLMSGGWFAVVSEIRGISVMVRKIEGTHLSNIIEINPQMIVTKILNYRDFIHKLESVNFPSSDRFEFYVNIDLAPSLTDFLSRFLSGQLNKKITIKTPVTEGMGGSAPRLAASNFDDVRHPYNSEYAKKWIYEDVHAREREERARYEAARREMERDTILHNPLATRHYGIDPYESEYIDKKMIDRIKSTEEPPKKKSKFSVTIDKEVRNLNF